MSILIDKNTTVIVQGITGAQGAFHTKLMLEYGTKVVAGVTPGKGGQSLESVPIYNTMAEAAAAQGGTASIIFVPARFAAEAIFEAADSGVKLIICITEGIPPLDFLKARDYASSRGARVIGPNCPGLITPGECKIGIMPGMIHLPGPVGVISRSGTLTYEIVNALTEVGVGQSTCIGIGGDKINGSDFVELLELFNRDAATRAVVILGEIGGAAELRAADYIAATMKIPAFAFIAGQAAPAEKRMGHAGAIISSGDESAAAKIKYLAGKGITVGNTPAEIARLVKAKL